MVTYILNTRTKQKYKEGGENFKKKDNNKEIMDELKILKMNQERILEMLGKILILK
jgi:hypothetical protein